MVTVSSTALERFEESDDTAGAAATALPGRRGSATAGATDADAAVSHDLAVPRPGPTTVPRSATVARGWRKENERGGIVAPPGGIARRSLVGRRLPPLIVEQRARGVEQPDAGVASVVPADTIVRR